ncbi:hypothetical protein [Candidatus Rickettsia kedanie]|uniref:POTRA domain-containing protein n=1 Tax=Candidatus Rickettsia kedanie TaxID=3115352 RepID=A0ABP9TYS9_9RICK
MKKLEQHFKKQRNDTDTQVKKYKKDLDLIGIRYDHKFAHVEVPNHATSGFEYFKWDWMTSTTGSHPEIVQIFKKIVSTLKEAKNNPAQYENLVSNLDTSTKNALDVNIKKHNITVPTPDTNKVISEILSGMQAWRDTKSHTGSGCDSAEQLWTKIGNLRISDDSNKATTSQASSESINSSDFKGNTSDADYDDDIEVISQLLASKVTLNNGKTIDVKKIIDAIYNPQNLDFYLRKLTPEINQLVKKEIALKLAYDFYNDSKELNEVRSISEVLGIKEEFNTYSNFSLEELKDEEVNITGGDYSYLE